MEASRQLSEGLGTGVSTFAGVRRTLTPVSPAAGADWSIVLGSGEYRRLIGGSARFVASIVVANRFPGFQVSDADGLPVFQVPGGVAVPASSAGRVNYYPGATTSAVAAGPNTVLAIPDLVLEPGWSVGSFTPNLDVGDTYTQVRFVVEEYDIGRAGLSVGLTPLIQALLEHLER